MPAKKNITFMNGRIIQKPDEKPTVFQKLLSYIAPFTLKKVRDREFGKIVGATQYSGLDSKTSLLTYAFMTIYPPESYEPSSAEFNGEKLKSDDGSQGAINAYILFSSSYLLLISNFLGLPSYLPNIDYRKADQNPLKIIGHILKNFIGWNSARPTGLKVVAAPFVLLWNLARFLPKLAWNVLTLVTEFIPHAIEMLSLHAMSKLIKFIADKHEDRLGLKILAGIAVGLLTPIYYISKITALVGGTITSPLQSMKNAYAAGKRLGGEGVLGKILGIGLATLSLAATVTIYAVLFPLAIKAIIVHAPTVISSAVSAAVNFLQTSSIVAKVGAALMKVLGPVVQPVISVVSNALGLAVAPALTSVGVTVGAAFASVGSALKLCGEKISYLWNKPRKEKIELVENQVKESLPYVRVVQPDSDEKPVQGVAPSPQMQRLISDLQRSGKKLNEVAARTSRDIGQLVVPKSEPINIPGPNKDQKPVQAVTENVSLVPTNNSV